MFEMIYKWFKWLFGGNLERLLSGHMADEEGFAVETIAASQYFQVGMITLAITLLFVLLYYYIFNHPRFNRWWSWLIVLLLTGVINLLLGFWWTIKYASEGRIDDIDASLVYSPDCWGFGFANFIISAMWFIVFSLAFKWWSRNCKYSPFKIF